MLNVGGLFPKNAFSLWGGTRGGQFTLVETSGALHLGSVSLRPPQGGEMHTYGGPCVEVFGFAVYGSRWK